MLGPISRPRLAALAALYVLAACSPLRVSAAGQAPAVTAPASASSSVPMAGMPRFRFETDWLKLPRNRSLGEISAVAVDRHDHVWLLHRPRTAAAGDGISALPPVVEFDRKGRFVRAFGGAGQVYEWPALEHSLALSAHGDIWIGGSGKGDDMVLVFARDGHFLRQIGHRGASRGNLDTANFDEPADIFVDDTAHEVYVADGYGNRRVIVLDERDGHFLRMWGAFGAPPTDVAESGSGPQPTGSEASSFKGVHAVEKAVDGLVYVSDRMHQRVQVFTSSGQFVRQGLVDRGLGPAATASGITLSRDRSQKFVFVVDYGNDRIAVLDRATMQTIGTIGEKGRGPGQFTGPHLIDGDSAGNLYVAEVQGRRLQRLVPCHRECEGVSR